MPRFRPFARAPAAAPAVPFARALLVLALAAAPAAGQRVAGRVVDGATGAPVAGAFLALVDEAGERRAAGLTGEDGAFALEPPEPGTYRIRVDRIGYRSIRTEWFALVRGETLSRRIEVAGEPIDLGAIEVGGRGRCLLRPEEGEAAWSLWSEARKALEIADWAESERRYRFRVIVFDRQLDPRSLVVDSEAVVIWEVEAERPFLSDSAERLERLRYIRPDSAGLVFYGLDAAALLSDPFLDHHCFRRVEGPDGAPGLAFEPVDPDAHRDIRGTLWLDPATAELARIEFRYVNPRLPRRVDPTRYGGVVEMQRLPDGGFVIGRWRIRTPSFGRRRRLVSFGEREADILEVRTVDGRVIPYARATGSLVGVVRDRRGRRVAGAEVRLEGTPYVLHTDAEGRYGVRGLSDARYRVIATGPDGRRLAREEAVVARGRVTTVDLGG